MSRAPRYSSFMIVGDPVTYSGHTAQVRTNDGSRYPGSCIYECLTCGVTIKICSGLHRYCAPAYLPSVLRSHVQSALAATRPAAEEAPR
jgi:hypothetical protein